MPSQEVTMPPTLPYPYSSEDDSSSSTNPLELGAKEVTIIVPPLSTDDKDFAQGYWKEPANDLNKARKQVSISAPDNLSRGQDMTSRFSNKLAGVKGDLVIGVGNGGQEYNSLFNRYQGPFIPATKPASVAFGTQETPEGSFILGVSWATLRAPLGFPKKVFAKIILQLDHNTLLSARVTARSWLDACDESRPIRFPSLYRLPVELIQLILGFSSPSSFNAARYTCRAWYLSSLDPSLLRLQLKTLGFYNADSTIQQSRNTYYLSMRLSREFSLGANGSNISGLLKTTTIDMSGLAATETIHFTVSICGSFALLSEGCVVYVYRLRATSEPRIELVASVVCPRRVLAVSMDTSSRRFAIAILLDGRMGLVHDVVEQESKSTYRNICSNEDVPRSVAICPQRRCVAFGCHGGIELHWVDALTGQDLNRWFPLTAPSDFLYFLPPRRGIDSTKKLRLISSAVHPNEASPLTKRFGVSRGSLAFWGTWEPRAGQSDHFQAVPLSDGYHILFMDPETGGLCLGSDAPLGGPTKLLRKIWLIPPPGFGKTDVKRKNIDFGTLHVWDAVDHDGCESTRPSVYASGADIRFGVRVVAGYSDHIVLFSIPPDLFDGSMRVSSDQSDKSTYSEAHQSQGNIVTESFLGSPKASWEPVKVVGCYIGKVLRLIDLAVDSGPNMAVYAFSANGEIAVFELEKTKATYYAGDQLKVTRLFSQRNGDVIREKGAMDLDI